jgi:predicted lysophospholipase L1 biosynthesis ABC-type transport system permease subunit
VLCPMCQAPSEPLADRCPACGTQLGYLHRHPRRVAFCVVLSIALGLGFFLALAWQTFAPLLQGAPAARPGHGFWPGFALATFFLTLGLGARKYLGQALRRLCRTPRT